MIASCGARLVHTFHDAHSLAIVRHWLRANINNEDVRADGELVATELITNAIEHTSGAGEVRIQISSHSNHDITNVRIEVDDYDSSTAVLTVGRSRLGNLRGRGLQMVDALAAWGVIPTEQGKTVWAELPSTPTPCTTD